MTTTRRQQRILRLVKKYQRLMGLNNWDITITFASDKMAAGCNADDEYLQALISFDLDKIAPADETSTVRHELAHCLNWELVRVAEHLAKRDKLAHEMIRAASERSTTLIERMPIWAIR